MLKKDVLPLVIFALLVFWLVGSWASSFLEKDNVTTTSGASSSDVSATQRTPTPSATPSPTPTLTATPLPADTATPTHTPSPTVTRTPSPSSTFTPIPIAFPTATPTPELAWQGRIVERDQTGAGTIGVRAAGLKDHPVILRSGGWQSEPQLTGTKVELGDYATEFGGLGPGDYTVELESLAVLTVTLSPGEFVLIEFRYDFVNPPTSTP